jgi:hypothetical protein
MCDTPSALQCLRITRELHRRCVGEVLAASRDGRLQQASAERTGAARHEDPECNELYARRAFATAALVHEVPRDIGDDAQAEDPRRQAHVDLHVAVEDVTELVADHRLQLFAIERVECALRHDDDRLVG